ncbi:MAG TPA: methyltransferase domain-containing protein [Gemmatimonadaceae bacterium]|nr:methyltransferase domain-containing protein [Gemmatimonadaceae bacterium]
MFVPKRRRGVEILDDPATPPAVRERSLRDVGRSNTLLGGTRAVLAELARLWPSLGSASTLLDVGTGLADIPQRARELAIRAGVSLWVVGVDEAETLARAAQRALDGSVCADARWLPFGDGAIRVVTCSQLLHHFPDDEIPAVLRELDRVARDHVVVSDLRRSWIAAGGFWLLAWVLGFHRVTRHDGTVSVLRGFTADELAAHVHAAIGRRPEVRRHLGYRLTATWRPSGSSQGDPPAIAGSRAGG